MKTVLITGVSSGIGEASKDYFLSNNYQVIGLDIKEIKEQNNLISFNVDITNKEELIKIRQYIKDNNIELDAIINVAGIHKMASLVEDDFDILKKVIDINVLGTMLINNVFHELLKKDVLKYNHIVQLMEDKTDNIL